MRRRTLLLSALLATTALLAACSGATSAPPKSQPSTSRTGTATQEATRGGTMSGVPSATVNPDAFVGADVTNPYFPLVPGTVFRYRGVEGGDKVEDVMTVTADVKVILGVRCRVVRDQLYSGGKLTEDTFDWYAQDRAGNVWYFGEDTKELENGKVTSTEGTWQAGKNGAQPGIIMLDEPKVGDSYMQEFLRGQAEDSATVISRNAASSVPYGGFSHVLETYESSPLEPGVLSAKFYVRGVGTVQEQSIKGPLETSELVSVTKP